MHKWLTGLLALLAVFTASPSAYACACCSQENTFYSNDFPLSDLSGISLQGNMGIYMYGDADEPQIDIAQSEASGTVTAGIITLDLKRDGASIGSLTLTPTDKATHQSSGLDFILSPETYKQLGIEGAAPIYHEISMKVAVKADDKLAASLKSSFAPEGIFTYHGESNMCWSPVDYPARWTFTYAVEDGKEKMEGMARGSNTVTGQ